MNIKNLAYIKALSPEWAPDLGAKLGEALEAIQRQSNNIEQQTNSNPTGQPVPPPQIANLQVSAQNGHFSAAIVDEGHIYRGVQYYIEHDSSPSFTNPQVVHLGDSRNHTMFLGNVTRYFRAYSSYSSSPASPPVYHGSSVQPTAVTGGGAIGGPAFMPSQGSGTGSPRVGMSGPGPIPFRSENGVPPVRGKHGLTGNAKL